MFSLSSSCSYAHCRSTLLLPQSRGLRQRHKRSLIKSPPLSSKSRSYPSSSRSLLSSTSICGCEKKASRPRTSFEMLKSGHGRWHRPRNEVGRSRLVARLRLRHRRSQRDQTFHRGHPVGRHFLQSPARPTPQILTARRVHLNAAKKTALRHRILDSSPRLKPGDSTLRLDKGCTTSRGTAVVPRDRGAAPILPR